MPQTVEWAHHGEAMTATLTGTCAAVTEVDDATAKRVYHLYLPIYFFTRANVLRRSADGDPVAIGLSAAQGSGKTTLVELLVARFAADGLTCAAVSIDDFYLRGAEQDELAHAHPDNPLFQVRGNAGTHDLALGTEVLRSLKRGRRAGDTDGASAAASVAIPRYDKSARSGRGDRAPEESWPRVPLPVDVVRAASRTAASPQPAAPQPAAPRPAAS